MHARHYAPEVGRFLQPDPSAAEANLYGYAGNAPVTKVDPSGTITVTLPPPVWLLGDIIEGCGDCSHPRWMEDHRPAGEDLRWLSGRGHHRCADWSAGALRGVDRFWYVVDAIRFGDEVAMQRLLRALPGQETSQDFSIAATIARAHADRWAWPARVRFSIAEGVVADGTVTLHIP